MSAQRVLLVEDEPLVLLVLAEVMADEGFEVVEAGNGDSAAALLDGPDGFDLVVTDIQMPGTRDGIAVGRHARRRHPDIPVVYVTGQPENMARAGRLGPRDAFVRKPYGPYEIAALARMLLPQRPGA